MGKIASAAKDWAKAQAAAAAKGAAKGAGKGIAEGAKGFAKGTKWAASKAWRGFLEPKWTDLQEARAEARKLKGAAEAWAKGVREGQIWRFGSQRVLFQLEGRRVVSARMGGARGGVTPLQAFALYFDPERPEATEPVRVQ